MNNKDIQEEILAKKAKDEYRVARSKFIQELWVNILAGVIICAIPALFMWATVTSNDSKSSSGGMFTTIIVFVGIAVFVIVIKSIIEKLSPLWDQLIKAKTAYMSYVSEEEKAAQRNKRKKIVHYGLICVGLVFLCILSGIIIKNVRVSYYYNKSEQMILSGHYQQAIDYLKKIEKNKYKDTSGLILLCESHLSYDRGDFSSAYYTLNRAEFKNQSFLKSEISDFKNKVDKEYSIYRKVTDEKQKKAYEEKIRNGVPFVGMPESRIGDTTLGNPSSNVRHNNETINGVIYKANLYDFFSGGKRIFCARCIQGFVTQVWDERGTVPQYYIPKDSKSSTDPSVDDFSGPDDFYEWYYDDFFDYEDAEDYYYEHGGT